MRSSLMSITHAVVLVTLIGWLLAVGRTLLIPFVIALIGWYLISALAAAIRAVPLGPYRLPNVIALPAALLAIFFASTVIIDMVADNLAELARDAPVYQQRLEAIVADLSAHLDLADPIELRDLMPDGAVNRVVAATATLITTLAGSASLVFVYIVFLLIEQGTFDRKFARLFSSPDRAALAFAMRREITRSIRHYVGIKTAMSALTGLLTSVLLTAIGLPYAVLFGFVAFLLNYIPTIGSMLAVVFPSLLSLVFFDDLGPFFAVAIGLGAIQFTIGNLIEPRLMGTSLNLSSLVILLSLSFWGAIWGVTGMVLCVPLTVLVLIVCAQFPAARPIAVLLSADGEVGAPLGSGPAETP